MDQNFQNQIYDFSNEFKNLSYEEQNEFIGKCFKVIPNQYMQDILQIWTFFSTFSENLKSSIFTKEELYVAIKYQHNQQIIMLVDLYVCLIKQFLLELQHIKQEENMFFQLYHSIENDDQINDVLYIIWPEILNQFKYIPEFTFLYEIYDHDLQLLLNEKNFNNLPIQTKLNIFKLIIECIYEFQTFQEIIQEKTQAATIMAKQKNDVLQDIKLDEQHIQSMILDSEKIQIKQQNLQQELEELKKSIESDDPQDVRKKDKEIRSIQIEINYQKNFYSNNQGKISKLENQIVKKKQQNMNVNVFFQFNINAAFLLGINSLKTEFWYFYHENDILFIKKNQSWYYEDDEKVLKRIMTSLNLQNQQEKSLFDYLQHFKISKYFKFQEPQQRLQKIDKSEEIILQELMDFNNEINYFQKDKSDRIMEDRKINYSKVMIYMIESIQQTEQKFFDFIETKNCFWGQKQSRQMFINDLKGYEQVDDLKTCLQKLQVYFQSVNQIQKFDKKVRGVKIIDDDELQIIELKLWSESSLETKQNWISYLDQVSNQFACYLCCYIFCKIVDKYVDKKIEKDQKKQQVVAAKPIENISKKSNINDDLDKYQFRTRNTQQINQNSEKNSKTQEIVSGRTSRHRI